jgi:hypothetical protein
LPGRDRDDGNGSRFDIAERACLLREHPSRRHPRATTSLDKRERKRLRQCTPARPAPSVPGADPRRVNFDKDFAWTRVFPTDCSKIIASGGPNACTRQAFINGESVLWDVLPARVLVILASIAIKRQV